jgi:uncharacterized membrane-anchored protein
MGSLERMTPLFSVDVPAWREDLYEELHARPFPFLLSPSQVSQLALMHNAKVSIDDEISHIKALCDQFNYPCPEDDTTCFYANANEFELRWERHTEFSTYTFILHEQENEPFQQKAIDRLPFDWLVSIPGEVVSAIHVSIIDKPDVVDGLDVLRQSFENQRLIGSNVAGEEAEVWTSFKVADDGFSRVLIYNKSLNKCGMGRLVQRIFEIENYRLMSLLALPLSQKAHSQINLLDNALCDAIKNIPVIQTHLEQKVLLGKLSKFSAHIERLRAQINYRSNATFAYSELVKKRLLELDEKNHPGLQSLGDFLERRFTPAVRTIMSVVTRLDDLSSRIDRATDLIRTRVDMTIEQQNQKLLASMNDRSRRQYSLQKTVESLSVVAMSYYLVELIKLTIPGARWFGIDLNADDVAVFSVPMIFVFVLLITRVIRGKITDDVD